MNTLSKDDIWNISSDGPQTQREARSPEEIFPVLLAHFGERPIRFLEIGVFEAGLFRRMQRSGLNIAGYVGVDPYLGTVSDPYRGAYWAETDAATEVYKRARAVIEGGGGKLRRQTSTEFFQSLGASDVFDVCYVDGDHRFGPALLDMTWALRVCADGGLIMVDDYANVTCPSVTPAFREFLSRNKHNIDKMGFCHAWIYPQGFHAPIVQSTIYCLPVSRATRTIVAPDIAANSPDAGKPSWRNRILDLSLRKVFRRLRRTVR